MHRASIFFASFAVLASTAVAQFTETEANDNKAGANGVAGIVSGGTITGSTTGTSTTVAGAASADNFLVGTAPLAPRIRRHEMAITTTGAVGHVGTLRGLNQSLGVAGTTDTAIQTSSTATTPARMNVWYGFGGASEQIYYRVTGVAATTAPYVSTLTSTPVTPINLGTHGDGTITLSTVANTTTDTDLWIYDSTFTAIPGYGNDDEPTPGTTLRSSLTRTFAPGTYYVAISNFQLASNQTSAADDRFRSGTLLDFPGVIANSSTTINLNLGITFTSSCGAQTFPITKTAPFQVVWGVFTVIPTTNLIAWDTNSAGSSLDVNGLPSPPNGPIDATLCVDVLGNVNLNSSNVGQGWEMGIHFNPAVAAASTCAPSGGGINTTNGQAVNLDFSDATLFFFNNLTFPPFPGPITIPFASPVAIPNITAQMLVFSPSHPDGFEMSSPIQIEVISGNPVQPGPVGDDAGVTLTAGTTPSNGCVAYPMFNAYGVSYTQAHVITNGRVTLGALSTSFTSAATYGAAEPAFAGGHGDFNQALGGTIGITTDGIGVSATYTNIAYFNQAGTAASFTISFLGGGTSDILLSGLNYGAPTAARNLFLGVHPGGAATIEAGFPTSYIGAGNFVSSVAGNSHGVFGDLFVGPLADAGDNLLFTYNNAGGYNVSY